MTSFAHVIHVIIPAHIPSICLLCPKYVISILSARLYALSSTSYNICQASSASPCAHAVTASLDSEVHLGHPRRAIQHAAAQSDVVQQH